MIVLMRARLDVFRCLCVYCELALLQIRTQLFSVMPKKRNNVAASCSPSPVRSKSARSAHKPRARSSTVHCTEDDFDAIASAELALCEAEASKMLPGPTTWDEVMSWPVDLVSRLKSHGGDKKMQTFMDMFKFGGTHNTDYSGFECPREMMHQLQKVLIDLYKIDGGGGNFMHRFVRSCDVGRLQRQVLLYMTTHLDNGKSCVLEDIEGCLDDWVVAELDAMVPHKYKQELTSEQKEEVGKAYADMWAWLVRDRDNILPSPVLSKCLTHGAYCPLFARREESVDSNALRFNWAGTTCTGWSSVGLQEGFTHVSERTHNVWLLQRVVAAERNMEDGFFQV